MARKGGNGNWPGGTRVTLLACSHDLICMSGRTNGHEGKQGQEQPADRYLMYIVKRHICVSTLLSLSPSRKNTLWPCHSSTPKSQFFCGGGPSGKVRAVRRSRRGRTKGTHSRS